MATHSTGDVVAWIATRRPWAGGLASIGFAAALAGGCSGTSGSGFGSGGAGPGPDSDAAALDSTAPQQGGSFSEEGGTLLGALGEAGGGTCKGGLYSGTFSGTYTSSLTLIGFPVPVSGNLAMTLTETESGSEFPVYTIQNGIISGLVYGRYPFRCTMVGTLDCSSAKLVGGGVHCAYCVGPTVGSLDDGGSCSLGGHFEGPLTADYDTSNYSFVDGTWNGSEEAVGDGGTPDGAAINEAGVYLGPGDYGGSGTWAATFDNGDE